MLASDEMKQLATVFLEDQPAFADVLIQDVQSMVAVDKQHLVCGKISTF